MTNTEQGVIRRRQIVEFVGGYIVEHGYSPTVREIGEGVGLASIESVQRHLGQLVEDGRLTIKQVKRQTWVYVLPEDA